MTKLHVAAALFAASLAPSAAAAADADGRFAVDGAGRLTCERFNQAREAGGPELNMFAGWIDGYTTGFNHFQDETFDVTPWQTVELLVLKMGNYCQEFPQERFIDALNKLILVLAPARLTGESPIVAVNNNGLSVLVYREQIDRIGARLVELKHLKTVPEDGYGPAMIAGLRAFQAETGIPESGLPDQATLNALFP
jgi:hypothetical protein